MKVMIVEDQTMIRSLLESYFRAEDGYRITASIPGAKQAVEMCRTNSVDLILMDVQTENRENGLIAVRQIKAIQPKSKIIVVTSLIDGAVLDEAKKAGADSLWYKDSTQKRLMDVVRQTLEGEHIFPDAPPTVEIGMAKSTEFTKTELKGSAASAAGTVLHAHCGRDGLRDVNGQIPCVKYAAKNRAGKQASACAGRQRRQVDCRSGGRMMGFDFLLVQPRKKHEPRRRIALQRGSLMC